MKEYQRLINELLELVSNADDNQRCGLKSLAIEQLQEAKIKLILLIVELKEYD